MRFSSSQQTLGWFRDRYREGTLVIAPPFQRKPVWVARQKCSLVESILLDLPVPEVYIQQTTTPEGKITYAVVDGQQRIRTVLQFIGAETDPEEQAYNKFVLDKFDAGGSPWLNLSFSKLSDEEKQRFYEYNFAVRFLYTEDDSEVRNMFERLNRYLTPLNAQELRKARYVGPFIHLSSRLVEDEYWAEIRFFTPAVIRRMRDIEFISDLLIGVLHGPQGGGSATIDEYYAQYEDYEDEFPNQRRVQKFFRDTLRTIQEVLPDIKDTRWSNKTDFYSLFVALASLLKSSELPAEKVAGLAFALGEFAKQVEVRFADETADVGNGVVSYVRAVEKGANDKPRRAARHLVLLELMKPYFRPKE
jgi:hypothetical protein